MIIVSERDLGVIFVLKSWVPRRGIVVGFDSEIELRLADVGSVLDGRIESAFRRMLFLKEVSIGQANGTTKIPSGEVV
jgi:hypothetical protein